MSVTGVKDQILELKILLAPLLLRILHRCHELCVRNQRSKTYFLLYHSITPSKPLGTQQCAPVNEGKNKYIRQPFSQGAQRITLLILDTILLFIQSEIAVLF